MPDDTISSGSQETCLVILGAQQAHQNSFPNRVAEGETLYFMHLELQEMVL